MQFPRYTRSSEVVSNLNLTGPLKSQVFSAFGPVEQIGKLYSPANNRSKPGFCSNINQVLKPINVISFEIVCLCCFVLLNRYCDLNTEWEGECYKSGQNYHWKLISIWRVNLNCHVRRGFKFWLIFCGPKVLRMSTMTQIEAFISLLRVWVNWFKAKKEGNPETGRKRGGLNCKGRH